MRILVTGSRGWTDRDRLCQVLNDIHEHYDYGFELAHGACPNGADAIADEWAGHCLMDESIHRYRANWDLHGKRAGQMRNEQMVNEFQPDLVVAFWDLKSPGTKGCINFALKNGYEVLIIPEVKS